MTTITFADHELDELKNFYQLELDKTAKRVEDLKGIIQKLSGQTQQSLLVQSKIESVIPESHHAKPIKTKNQTISWRTFIPRLLKKEDRYLNAQDIVNAAIGKFNLTNRVKTLHTLTTTLARMTKMGILKSERKEGQKNNYYGLTSWTTESHVVSTDKETATNGAEVSLTSKTKSIRKTKTQVIPWRKFIPQLIKKEGSLTIHDFVNAAMTKFHYPNRDKLVRTLSPTLARMTKMGKLTYDRKPGQKTYLYGLPSVPAKIKGTNGKTIVSTHY